MTSLRADAARNRRRILDAARERDVGELRLNDVAHDAGIGVATVYRHFPTLHALIEALSRDRLEALAVVAQNAAAQERAIDGFELFVREGLDLQLQDGGLQLVLLSDDDGSAETRDLKREIMTTFAEVFERARAAGELRPGLTVEQVHHLVCGVEHAVRIGTPGDREPLLTVVLAGLRRPNR